MKNSLLVLMAICLIGCLDMKAPTTAQEQDVCIQRCVYKLRDINVPGSTTDLSKECKPTCQIKR